ncbi:MAG: ComEC/Rec2 family competence protein [Coleofasciculaceae cyanobacterium]
MNLAGGALLSLAYIFGLLSTAILGLPTQTISWQEYGLLATGICILGIISAIALPKFWRTGPKSRLWLIAGIIAAIAPIYFQARTPQPASNDISQFVRSNSGIVNEQVVTIQGKVDSSPRLTRSSKGQFWLEATQLNEVESSENNGAVSKSVRGKLYVTVPLLQATGLYPGQIVTITGVLYKPKPALNPGAFDFNAYLISSGAFAGFSGRQVNTFDEQQQNRWGRWAIQQRISRSQLNWLDSPKGQLITSMVLGAQAVDIPFEIRDQFVKAGLAHILAASGTQVSLILGYLLILTKRFSIKTQLLLGTGGLILFVFLTGIQPSVLRATIMGFGALIALVTQRKVKPLGSLLVAATLLLLFNPLWIWDLGFQLSFLATLGLLVTVPPLTKRLDWLPPAIAFLIAIPLAASLWTLPLQLYVFGIIAPYSTLANIISAPLISLISIGGFISALAAVFWTTAGSATAWLLNYPTQFLITIVQLFNQLPGNAIAVGTISVVQVLVLYGLISILSINKQWQKRWWLVGLVAISLIALPVWQTKAAQFKVTVLAAAQEQVLVIQDQGQVTLINSGEADTASFTVLPFLQKQGVNQINWAIAVDSQPRLRTGWSQMLSSLKITTFYDSADAKLMAKDNQAKDVTTAPSTIATAIQNQQGTYQQLTTGQTLPLGSTAVELINAQAQILQLKIRGQNWLLLGSAKPDTQTELLKTGNLAPIQVLWWSGERLLPELLAVLKPKVAIASSNTVDLETAQLMRNAKIPLYWTGRDGAVQWTTRGGFETTLETVNNDAPLL